MHLLHEGARIIQTRFTRHRIGTPTVREDGSHPRIGSRLLQRRRGMHDRRCAERIRRKHTSHRGRHARYYQRHIRLGHRHRRRAWTDGFLDARVRAGYEVAAR